MCSFPNCLSRIQCIYYLAIGSDITRMVQLCDQSSGSTGLCLLHLESRVTVTQPQAEEQSDYETNSAIRLSVQRE